jgi:molybdopterin-guanine dinucleotide biosynthesis protein
MMKQFHVAGWRSGAGKTTVVCALLEALDGWGALKTSTHAVPSAGHGPPGVVTDPAVLAKPGSDTARYLAHGAARVAWLRATPESLERDLPEALERFEGLPGVLVEGNSPWAFRRGDRLVLVVGRGTTDRVKRSAAVLARDADLAVLDRGPGGDQRDRWLDRFAPEVTRLRADLGSPDGAGLDEVVRQVVTWSRA